MELLWGVQPHRTSQILTLARMAGRYSCYYLTRNSLTYTAPVMVSDPALKMDITQARRLKKQHVRVELGADPSSAWAADAPLAI